MIRDIGGGRVWSWFVLMWSLIGLEIVIVVVGLCEVFNNFFVIFCMKFCLVDEFGCIFVVLDLVVVVRFVVIY